MKKEAIDFSGVPEDRQQRGRHIPPGNYVVKISKVEKKWKDDDKSNAAYFNWALQVAEGKEKGAPLYFITSLKPDALFNLRNLIFAALGKNVAGKSLQFDPEKLLNKKIGAVVEDDEYNNKIRSRVVDVMPVSEMGDTDDEEEDDDEEEEETADDDEELEDVELDEL